MDIKMNNEQWADLPGDGQRQVEEIVRGFFKGARIVPEAEAPRSEAQQYPHGDERGFCEIGCNVAEAAAKAACNAIGNPTLRQACIAAATAAGQLCRDQC
jgi:hypothetical protein